MPDIDLNHEPEIILILVNMLLTAFFFCLYCEMQNLVFIYCPKSWSVTSGTEIEIVYWTCVID